MSAMLRLKSLSGLISSLASHTTHYQCAPVMAQRLLLSTHCNNHSIHSQYYSYPNIVSNRVPLFHRFATAASQNKDNETTNAAEDSAAQSDEESEHSTIEESESEPESDQEEDPRIAELEAEVNKYRDALTRSHADLINVQNMSQRDVENARNFAIRNFSKDILSVADALQGALKSVEDKEFDFEKMPELKVLLDGVKLTEKSMMDTFSRHGIKHVASLGEEFDPNVHECMFNQPTDEYPPNTVCHVLAEGYSIKDFVLRPAKVGISVAPPTQE